MGRNRETIGDVLAATPELTLDDLRNRIEERVDRCEMTSIGFDTCSAFYNQDMNEWILISPTESGVREASHWDDLASILYQVPDQDIQAWYERWARADYEDEDEDDDE